MLRVRVQIIRFPGAPPESMRNPLEPMAGLVANSRCESHGQKLLSPCPFLQAAEQWHRWGPPSPPVALPDSARGSVRLSGRHPAPLASHSSLGRPLEGTSTPKEQPNPSALPCTLQYQNEHFASIPAK